MIETDSGSNERDRERSLEWSSFVVEDTPHCMWAIEMREQNLRFLRGIDPTFYRYLSETHAHGLGGAERKNAALALRLAYAQSLETLFALLGATIQAPNCPLGWMLMYETRQLYSVVRKLVDGAPLFARDVTRPMTWSTLSEDIHPFKLDDSAEEARIKRLFATSWAMLAHDFLDEAASEEYNSIKHGLRVQTAGSSLVMHAKDVGDRPILESESEFGNRFLVAEPLSDKWRNFYAVDAARNWTPDALAIRMEIVALSINNLIVYLRARLGDSHGTLRFLWPVETEDLKAAWKNRFIVESMRGGIRIEPTDIAPLSASEIVEGYEPLEPRKKRDENEGE